jgi:proline iminopeptidase
MRASVNGTELYFDVEGPQLVVDGDRLRERPTLLVLHGGPGFDQGYLRPGLGPLADDAQLVFVDLRGQGRSAPVPVESCTLEQMADDVAALCEQVGIERPIVFGHSAGGFVALHLAVRHPGLPGGLILCGTAPAPGMTDDAPPPSLAERAGPEVAALARRLFGGDVSLETQMEFGRVVVPCYAGPEHMDVPYRLLGLSDIRGEITAYYFAHLASHYDLRPRLAAITAPTLVIVGSEDWVCEPAASRHMARAIPGARLVEVPGAGHFLFSETPDEFLAAARELIVSAT